ncbi:L-threonine dehydratase biosynthetic IlvA [Phytophthora cinnamomi]|uniref:L-threonine dehydratase biosynthetic IlvA n=1 Tax=Phytophthora cinnamomi TaxID=4785 RepID=UPI0035598829|nr:L-threonine dehydratase biosynthetic IlvA [Phytophthora cinnamomi]
MGKSIIEHSIAAEQEFAKLELLIVQTANDASKCLKVLKSNLALYDKRHGLRFRNTSRSFMRSDIRVAKDSASDLRHVATRIRKSKVPTESEINAGRISMNETAEAMNDLKKSGHVYDENNGISGGTSGIMGNILGGKDDKENVSKGGLFTTNDKVKDSKTSNKPNGGMFGSDNKKTETRSSGGILKSDDTVEAVVRSTLRDSFSGFNALEKQISTTEKALSPSLAERAKEAVVDVANKLVGDTSYSSPTRHGRKDMSM